MVKEYIKFEPSVVPLYSTKDEDSWYLFKGKKLLVKKKENGINIIKEKDLKKLNLHIDNVQCMGAWEGYNCFSGEINIKKDKLEDYSFMDLKSLSTIFSEEEFLAATKGLLLLNWMKSNRYCGICGNEMKKKDSKDERAMICTNCNYTTWPRTSPAVIVAVTKGDKLLLAHNRGFSKGVYSVIAGFVEYGETFEQCVKREVYEETGIKVKNIKYFDNQPWPFPNSMMIGFTAEYLEGEIQEDNEEIVHADWFSKDEIKKVTKRSKSIGYELIEWFVKTH